MKKMISLLLVIGLILCLCACSKKPNQQPTAESTTVQPTEPPLVIRADDGTVYIDVEQFTDLWEVVELTTENWRDYIKVYSFDREKVETDTFGDVVSRETETITVLGAGNERYHYFKGVAVELKDKETGELTTYEFYGFGKELGEPLDLERYDCTRIKGQLIFVELPEEAIFEADDGLYIELGYQGGFPAAPGFYIDKETRAFTRDITIY